MVSNRSLANPSRWRLFGSGVDHDSVSNPDSIDRRFHYTEHQVQCSRYYRGPLADLDPEEVRVLAAELSSYVGLASYWPLPPAGLPGVRDKTDRYAPAGMLLALGMQYADAILNNERRSMHLRWEAAEDFIAELREEALTEYLTAYGPNKEARDAPQKVYFIASESGPVKIGVAINPQNRLQSLQTGHHEVLSILATCEGGAAQERAYHRQFAEHRLSGEWFTRVPAIEAEIERLKAA